MSPTKHTQGPWSVNHETDITGIENDQANDCVGIVDVAHVYLRTVPGRTEANANLIAAAPELLLSVRALIEILETGVMSLGALRAAKAVVAKATGENA